MQVGWSELELEGGLPSLSWENCSGCLERVGLELEGDYLHRAGKTVQVGWSEVTGC